jgi:hypothetical protein
MTQHALLWQAACLALVVGPGGGRIEDRSPPVATAPALRVVASLGDDIRDQFLTLFNIWEIS